MKKENEVLVFNGNSNSNSTNNSQANISQHTSMLISVDDLPFLVDDSISCHAFLVGACLVPCWCCLVPCSLLVPGGALLVGAAFYYSVASCAFAQLVPSPQKANNKYLLLEKILDIKQ